MADSPYDEARAVYARLKHEMQERGFLPEHYVAIAGGKLVADSDSLDVLREKVRALGLREEKVMFDQVGHDMLTFRGWPGWITANAAVNYWVACLLPIVTSEQ